LPVYALINHLFAMTTGGRLAANLAYLARRVDRGKLWQVSRCGKNMSWAPILG